MVSWTYPMMAHGSMDLLDGGGTGGCSVDCHLEYLLLLTAGGVEPEGVLLPPGLPPGHPPPGGCAPPEPLDPGAPPPGYGLLAGLDWPPAPDPVPPPGPSGGPAPPDALGRVCKGVHSLGYVTALEVALPGCIGAGGGGGDGI